MILRFYSVTLTPVRLFGMFFQYRLAQSLSVVLQLSNITPGGSEARVVGRNTRPKGDNKENHIIGSIITSKESLSVKICK